MELDDFDCRILGHFAARYPKPTSLVFCPHDSTPELVTQICRHPRLYEDLGLLMHFWLNNVSGMLVGDQNDFPAFAGDMAVYLRRHGNLFLDEIDLIGFYLHASPRGAFSHEDRLILKEWAEDVLLPWRRRPQWPETLPYFWEFRGPDLAVAYLGLYCVCGGDPSFIVAEHTLHSEEKRERTKFLYDLFEFLGDNGAGGPLEEWFNELRQHLYITRYLPQRDQRVAVAGQCSAQILTAIKSHAERILNVW